MFGNGNRDVGRAGSAERVTRIGRVSMPATKPGGVAPGRLTRRLMGRGTVSRGQVFVKGCGPRPGRRRRGVERAHRSTRDCLGSPPSAQLVRSVLQPLARLLRSANQSARPAIAAGCPTANQVSQLSLPCPGVAEPCPTQIRQRE